jgi:hypothetical protein
MIIRGAFVRGKPIVTAYVQLPRELGRFTQDFLIDTASTFTFLSDELLPSKKGFAIKPVRTVIGRVPAFVVPHCRYTFGTDQGPHQVESAGYFLKSRTLSRVQWFLAKRLITPAFPRKIEPPRMLLGRDILDDFCLVISKPWDVVALTTEPHFLSQSPFPRVP